MQKAVFDYLRFIQALIGIAILINGLASGQTAPDSLSRFVTVDSWVYLAHSILGIVCGIIQFVSLILGITAYPRRVFSIVIDILFILLMLITSTIQATHLPKITKDIQTARDQTTEPAKSKELQSLGIQFIVSVLLGILS